MHQVEIANSQPPPPPLRIHHLMVITAVMAVTTAAVRPLIDSGEERPLSVAAMLTWVAAKSIALTVVGFGCWWRRQGMTFFDQPGHGYAIIILLGAVSVVWWIGLSKLGAWLGGEAFSSNEPSALLSAPQALLLTLAVILALRMRRRLADTRAWRWVFLFEALNSLFGVVGSLLSLTFVQSPYAYWAYDLYYLTNYGVIGTAAVIVLLMGVAAVDDLRSRTPRHWTHWTVVIAAAASYLLWVVIYASWWWLGEAGW